MKTRAQKASATMKRKWADPEFREKRRLAFANPEVRERMSQSAKKSYENNPVRCKQQAENVSNAWRNYTPEQIEVILEKRSLSMQRACQTSELKTKIKIRSRKQSKRQKKLWQDPEYRKQQLVMLRAPKRCKKIGETGRKQYASGKRKPPNGTYRSCTHGWLKTRRFGSIYYNSSWEKAFMELVDESSLVSGCVKEKYAIPYKFEDKQSSYFPDFFLKFQDGRKFVIELKGFVTERDYVKFEAAEKWCKKHGYEFMLVNSKPPAKLSRYVRFVM